MPKNNEIWKDIPKYEGLYQVSNLGNVKSLNYNNEKYAKLLIPQKHKNNYLFVNLKGKIYSVHRLVAITFIENNKHYNSINHKDGNKQNNCVENLEWCSYSYNLKHAYKNGLKVANNNHLKKEILQFDKNHNFIKKWESTKRIEKELGISHSNISSCCKKRKHYNSAKGFIWEYANDKK